MYFISGLLNACGSFACDSFPFYKGQKEIFPVKMLFIDSFLTYFIILSCNFLNMLGGWYYYYTYTLSLDGYFALIHDLDAQSLR